MADMSKLKAMSGIGRRSNLGAPPALEEATDNLNAPEVAPARSVPVAMSTQSKSTREPLEVVAPTPRRDGRSMRRSGRTIQFATRVSPEFDNKLRDVAEAEGFMLVEILERALDLYISKMADR